MTTEESALVLNRDAVLSVVSALRRYRAAVRKVLETRYSDGSIDGYYSSVLEMSANEIESDLSIE